ncbi:MAG: sugar phosphate isomerase/epimerase [bacterium]
MYIGIMNNPQKPLEDEIQYLIDHEFDFLDYSMEPPQGLISSSKAAQLRRRLSDYGKFSIGHTAYYLPIDTPFQPLRNAVTNLLCDQFDIFSEFGSTKVAIHLGFSYPHRFFTYAEKYGLWAEVLALLVPEAEKRGLTLILENVLNSKESLKLLKDLTKNFDKLGLLLDVGHANLNMPVNTVHNHIKLLGHRLQHVHLSDNFAKSDDLHLPLGAGGIPWGHVLKLIKQSGYNATFTLEIFSKERDYLLKSREFLRAQWAMI